MLVTEVIAADKTEIINRPGEAGAVLLTSDQLEAIVTWPLSSDQWEAIVTWPLSSDQWEAIVTWSLSSDQWEAGGQHLHFPHKLLQISLRFVPSCRYFLATVIPNKTREEKSLKKIISTFLSMYYVGK